MRGKAAARPVEEADSLHLGISSIVATVISPGWKWLAVLIGLAAVVVLFGIIVIVTGDNPKRLFEGQDGLSSTSKFQWLLWLVIILFAYVALWVLRAKGGDYSALPEAPANVLTVLGFSTVTAAAAKGIASAQAARPGGRPAPAAGTSGLIQDDTGVPELAKIQMIAFTLVAIGIYVATLSHQIASTPVITKLPDIDKTLMVLMGLSQGGYLGKKLVS